jgi:hypothetical protein
MMEYWQRTNKEGFVSGKAMHLQIRVQIDRPDSLLNRVNPFQYRTALQALIAR